MESIKQEIGYMVKGGGAHNILKKKTLLKFLNAWLLVAD